MGFSSSSFVDGDIQTKYRAVHGTGTSVDPYYTGVALHPAYFEAERIRVTDEKYAEHIGTPSITSSLSEVYAYDTRKIKLGFLRINNTGSSNLSDFIVDIAVALGYWDEIANGDFFYTTGQGENTGNVMSLVRKCSPVNPRTLSAGQSTWLILNLEHAAYFRIRAKTSSSTTTLTIRAYYTIF